MILRNFFCLRPLQLRQSEDNNQNIEENNNIIAKDNSIKVESKIIYAEEIVQSITLQGQTIHNRTINVKSETTGNIWSCTKRDDI